MAWPRQVGAHLTDVQITIEVSALGVEPPAEARQFGCAAPRFILLYPSGPAPDADGTALGELYRYKLTHPTGRVVAKITGTAWWLPYPRSFRRRPSAGFYVKRVLAIWSEPEPH